jgi:hypothetical protein
MCEIEWPILVGNLRLSWTPAPLGCGADWAMLLEYLKVLLSWPPLVFVGAMICIWRFEAEIARLIARLKEFKAGNVSAVIDTAQQAQAGKVEVSLPGTAVAGPVAQHQAPQVELAPQAAQANGQAPGIDWTIAQEAVDLSPPGVDLQVAAAWIHRNPGPTVRDYVMAMTGLKSERCFNLIFGTQVELLEYLRVSPGNHTLVDLMPFHELHIALASAPQPVAIHAYLEFLLIQGLMENVGPPDGPLYRISRFGEWFLAHIKQYYPMVWNRRGL